jgi:hypothetical protein
MTYEKAAEFVIAAAFEHVGAVKRVEGGNEAEVAAADSAVAAAEAALARVAAENGVAVGDVPAAWPVVVALREAEDARLGLTLAGGREWTIFPAGQRGEFGKLAAAEQRKALRAVVKKAVLHPGTRNGPVEDRITVEFVTPGKPPKWVAPVIEDAPPGFVLHRTTR